MMKYMATNPYLQPIHSAPLLKFDPQPESIFNVGAFPANWLITFSVVRWLGGYIWVLSTGWVGGNFSAMSSANLFSDFWPVLCTLLQLKACESCEAAKVVDE